MSSAISEINTDYNSSHESTPNRDRFHRLVDKIVAGHSVTRNEAKDILESHDDELLDLMSAAFRLRQRHFGKTVQLYFLMNAKSGLCPEAGDHRLDQLRLRRVHPSPLRLPPEPAQA